jgi:predicted lipoprotein with Yx(FWY)xxD motif
MGSVVQMRLMKAIVLAIVVAMALAGGGGPAVSASATTTGPTLVAEAGPFGAATNDPADPGLPPD